MTIDPLVHPQVADVDSSTFFRHQTCALDGIEACSAVSLLVHLLKPINEQLE